MQRTVQRPVAHRESRADLATWAGNSLAVIGAGVGIAAGAIGLLVAFGYINEGSTAPFNDGLTWLLGGLIVTIVANVFRREHHVVDASATSRTNQNADNIDMVLGNGLGFILGGLAIASGVIGLLLNFEYIKDGNTNPFQDALIWFTAGGVLAFAALTFRREPHVGDTMMATGRVEYDETVYDEGDLRAAPPVDSTPRGRR